MGFVWWLLIVALWVIFLSVTMSIARSKGHSPLLWGLLAVFLPGITLIIVLLLPNRALA
jgi:Na+-translocating ferredoxin:NAD+ oxidoreductase RnfA subunit